VNESQRAYREILDHLESDVHVAEGPHGERRELRRAIRSAARSLLPEATETTVFFTANARALRHFLAVRGGILGDEEMRLTSAELLKAMRREAPSLFADFEITEVGGLPLVQKVEGA